MIGQPLSFAKKTGNASMTVEAAIVTPIFLFAVFMYIFLIRLVGCQDDVQWALTRVAKEASYENAIKDSELFKSKTYLAAKMSKYLDGSNMKIRFSKSRIMEENDEIDLIAEYEVALPIALFSIRQVPMKQRVRTRAFTGVERRTDKVPSQREVYITESGRVYHLSPDCTYLKPSISKVQFRDLEGLRNENGGKYKACRSCCAGINFVDKSLVYIANYGERYHSKSTCSKIQHTVLKVDISEVGNRLVCSKCSKDGEK